MTPSVETPAPSKARAPLDLLLVSALVLLCYAPAVVSLVRDWSIDADMGHGFFVPVVVGYIVWLERENLRATPLSADWRGLLLVGLGAMESLVGTIGVEMFVARFALIVTLTGVVWTFCGTVWLRKLAFPLLLLCFMVPLPALVMNSITLPLQMVASEMAAAALTVLGVPVLREGNILQLPSGPLSVVEACSGIRSLLSLTFLSLVYGYFFERTRGGRLLLLLATVPIALVANAGRITVTGLISLVRPEWAQGFFHESTGWVIFMIALGILLGFHRMLLWGARHFRASHT